jgi:hypothetical protein
MSTRESVSGFPSAPEEISLNLFAHGGMMATATVPQSPSFFDVSQSLFGRFEWKDPIHNWTYDPGIDERANLA